VSRSSAATARATTLLDLGRHDEALTVLGTALAEEPASAPLLCLTARAHLARGDGASALVAANAAVASDPDEEWAHRLASLALSAVGQPREAVRAAIEATRLAPTDWQTHHTLAMALSRANEHTQAMEAARCALRMAPDQHEAHFALGFAAMNAGHSSLARDAFKRALALDPGNSAALNNLAKLGMKQGRLLSAAHGLSASLAANPQSEVARYNVDVLARHLLLWLHWTMVSLCFVLSAFVPSETGDPVPGSPFSNGSGAPGVRTAPVTPGANSSGWLAILTPLLFVAFVAAVLVLDRRLPRALRGYYRRLPRTDRYIGAWLALELGAFALLLGLGFPQTPTNRSTLVGLAFLVLVAGMIVSRMGASRMDKRRAALPS
jgi:Flp pilus assembly protein TadD